MREFIVFVLFMLLMIGAFTSSTSKSNQLQIIALKTGGHYPLHLGENV